MQNTAVVILNYNGKQHLKRFLPSVTSTSDQAEIWVADNGSTDDSLHFLRQKYPNIKLVELPKNYGFAEGYNQALKQITADFYILLNSDVKTTPNWITPIIEAMKQDPSIAAAQPKILNTDEKTFDHAGGAGGWIDKLGYPFCRGRILDKRETDTGQYDDPQEIFWASGAAMFIRADLYHKAGGLDGQFFAHMEEIDLCWRLKLAGYKIMAYPQSLVYHLGGGTLDAQNPQKTYLNFRNSLITLLKNEPATKLLWLFPARLILDGIAGIRFLTQGKLLHIWAIIRAHFYCYGHIRNIAKRRQQTQQSVEDIRIGEANTTGRFEGSIIWSYFVKGKKTYRRL